MENKWMWLLGGLIVALTIQQVYTNGVEALMFPVIGGAIGVFIAIINK